MFFGIFKALQDTFGDKWWTDPLVWLFAAIGGILIGNWVFG